MTIETFNCEQGTAEWFACRAGIPTASEFSTVMAQGKTKGSPSVTRRKYMLKLIGEQMTGETEDGYTNAHMERGKVMEAEARDLYVFRTDAELKQVGFIRNHAHSAGCSPDSLIGDDGILEVKTKLPSLQLELLLSGGLPSEHRAQVQGMLWVTGRKWVDFISYWPRLPLHKVRVVRDEDYIAEIAAAVKAFNREMADLQETLRRGGLAA